MLDVPAFAQTRSSAINFGFAPLVAHEHRTVWEAALATGYGAPTPFTEFVNATVGVPGGFRVAPNRSVYAPLTLFALGGRNALISFDYLSSGVVRGCARTGERVALAGPHSPCAPTVPLAAQRDGGEGDRSA